MAGAWCRRLSESHYQSLPTWRLNLSKHVHTHLPRERVGLLEPSLLSGAWRGRRPSVNVKERSEEVSRLSSRHGEKCHSHSTGRWVRSSFCLMDRSKNRGKGIEGDRGAREADRGSPYMLLLLLSWAVCSADLTLTVSTTVRTEPHLTGWTNH